MATALGGPSGLTPVCLCKSSNSHGSYSSLHSHSNQNWVSPLSLFQGFSTAIHVQKPVCRSGLTSFTCWNAKAYLGQPLIFNAVHRGLRKQGRCRLVKASLFGVGAPEALVIGVVALLVFGPKGLAEVARTLGKSLRAFQPTIREIQEVSREFKNTLEQEIGLDELRSPIIDTSESASQKLERQKVEQNGPPPRKAYSTEDYLRVTEDEIKALVPEEKPKASEGEELGSSSSATGSPNQSSEDGKANNDKVV